MSSKKLFVGGLAWATDDESLRSAFEQYGTVTDAKVIMDRETGRSRGFGFVTYENAADADQAQQKMDGMNLDGRTVRVNEAEDKRAAGGGGGGGGDRRPSGGGGPRSPEGSGGGDRPPRRGGGGGGGGGRDRW